MSDGRTTETVEIDFSETDSSAEKGHFQYTYTEGGYGISVYFNPESITTTLTPEDMHEVVSQCFEHAQENHMG